MNKKKITLIVMALLLFLVTGCNKTNDNFTPNFDNEDPSEVPVITEEEEETVQNISKKIKDSKNLDFNNRGLTEFKLQCEIDGIKDVRPGNYYGFLIDGNNVLYKFTLGGHRDKLDYNCTMISNRHKYNNFLGDYIVDTEGNVYSFSETGEINKINSFNDLGLKYAKDNNLSFNKISFYHKNGTFAYVYVDDNKVYNLPSMRLIKEFNEDITNYWGGVIKTTTSYYLMSNSGNYTKTENISDNIACYYSFQPEEKLVLLVDKYNNVYNNIVGG